MRVNTMLPFTTPGTYSLSIDGSITLIYKGTAGGGGGGSTGGNISGAGGGGGGATTTGTTVVLVPSKTYTLVVGRGGAGGVAFASGTNGGATSFTNTTDARHARVADRRNRRWLRVDEWRGRGVGWGGAGGAWRLGLKE